MISTNHYQAPVRRFILDVFDIPFEPDTLVQLRHLELASYSFPKVIQTSDGEEHEARRRSASSPGPEPPGRMTRARGLTVSEMGPNMVQRNGDHEPRERISGFGVAAK